MILLQSCASLLLTLSPLGTPPVALAAQAAAPPNVVLILADDLGWGELGCYGQGKIRTPHLDRLAAQGMRFTRHYAGSAVCAPSRCVLLTGLHTGHARVRDNWENGGWGPQEPEGQLPLLAGTSTLATRLSAAGYATGAFGKWGLGGPGTSGAPLRQGFDTFLGYLCQRKAHNYYPTHLWQDDEKLVLEGNPWFSAHQKLAQPLEDEAEYAQHYASAVYAPDVMLAGALDFVRAQQDEPFFLYYPSPIPHVALQVPDEDVERYPAEWDAEPYLGQKAYLPHPSPRRAYAAMITRLDAEVGRILDLLDELDLAQNTLVLFSSDNGPTYAGGVDYEFFDSAGGLRGLKGSLYEGGVRVPLIARLPGRIAAGSSTDHVSAFQDILPTLLELIGAEPQPAIDGLSFAPTLLGRGEQAQHEALYWEFHGKQALIADGRWKAVRPRVGKGDLSIELYDLERDPGEARDLAGEQPERVAALAARMAAEHTPSPDFPVAALDAGAEPRASGGR